jgi:hypothetical protein
MLPSTTDRNQFMLTGPLARKGYDWWWHNFTARHEASGAEKAFFIEYFLCNPGLGDVGPKFGGPGEPPSYGMLKVGCWGEDARQVHDYFGWDEIEIGSGELGVRLGQNRLSETQMSGAVAVKSEAALAHPERASDAGALRWNLSIDKQIGFSVGWGAGAAARRLNLFEMYWHAAGIKTAYSGWIDLDGERYLVTPETSFGYADKNWGSNFTSPWIWIGSSDLRSRLTGLPLERSALEIGGGRPRVLGLPLAGQALVYLVHEGTEYEFNFSKPWLRSRVSFDFIEGEVVHRWTVSAETPRHRLEVELSCPRSEMLLMRYQSPDGARRHQRLWNGGTGRGTARLLDKARPDQPLDLIEIGHAGCEWGTHD